MNIVSLYGKLTTTSPKNKRRPTPEEIDASLFKKAQEDPNIQITTYFDKKGEIKGHGFDIKDGPLITTRFRDGEIEGSVGIIDPKIPALREGSKLSLEG